MIRVAIVDDDALIRESLAILLEGREGITIAGQGQNGLDALALCKGCDVMLLDLRMPVKGGLEVLEELIRHSRVLVLTTFDDDAEMVKSLQMGAHGYLLKSATPDSIAHAIVEISRGKNVFDTVAMEAVRRNLHAAGEKRAELTPREADIAACIAEGLNNKQIAERLFLSEGTVKNHISVILQKSGLEHRTQIAISRLKGEL